MIRSKILLVRLTRVVQETSHLFHVQFLATCKQLVRNVQCTRMLHGNILFLKCIKNLARYFPLHFAGSCRYLAGICIQNKMLQNARKRPFLARTHTSCKIVLQDCIYQAVVSFHAVCKALRDKGWLALSACHILLTFFLAFHTYVTKCRISAIHHMQQIVYSQPHLSRHLIWPE